MKRKNRLIERLIPAVIGAASMLYADDYQRLTATEERGSYEPRYIIGKLKSDDVKRVGVDGLAFFFSYTLSGIIVSSISSNRRKNLL